MSTNLFFIELICIALVESQAPSLLTRLLGIICATPPLPDDSSGTQIAQETIFEKVWRQLIMKFSRLEESDKQTLFDAYKIRILMTIMRGEIASETDQIQYFRTRVCKMPTHGISHRNHVKIAELDRIQSSTSENLTLIVKTISNIVSQGTQDMDKNDIVFNFKNYLPVSKQSVDGLLTADIVKVTKWMTDATKYVPNLFNNFIYYMNDIMLNTAVKILTQDQVDALLLNNTEVWNVGKIITFLCQKLENTVYVIFEDRSNMEPDIEQSYKLLLYGFQLRPRNQNNSDEIEIVVLVPEASIFQVLNPLSYAVIDSIKNELEKKGGSKKENISHVKKQNKNLVTEYYDKGNVLLNCMSCMVQAHSLLLNTQQRAQSETAVKNYALQAIDYIFK